MVGTRNGTNTKVSAKSYGRLHDISHKHTNAKNQYECSSSTKKVKRVTRAGQQRVTTPPELKRQREDDRKKTGRSPPR
eukprot:scaffold11281_cov65-Attheya_sp.AAC.3